VDRQASRQSGRCQYVVLSIGSKLMSSDMRFNTAPCHIFSFIVFVQSCSCTLHGVESVAQVQAVIVHTLSDSKQVKGTSRSLACLVVV
jgi:hypothetical protein